jgi:aminopeptidase N
MLRRRLGDETFLKAIGDLCRRYRYQSISTEDFREHLAQYTPEELPDRKLVNFFDQWVYDTGIPTLNVSERIRGNAPQVRVTVTLTQSRVPDYFSTLVPVELRFAGGRVIRRWLQTSEEPVTLDVTVEERPEAVVCNPGDAALAILR